MYLDGFINRASKSIFNHDKALKYLKRRGITEEDILKYSIGYLKYAKVNAVDSEDFQYLKERTWNFKGLQNRIIFPLRNVLGRVNGLILRDIDAKKYVQIFFKEAKKIGGFFGLKEALPHIMETRKVFVHEGAIDCISFAKVFPNSVSVLTSLVNEQQFETLRFFADKIILVFDNDKPGKIGTYKAFKYYGQDRIHAINIGYGDTNKCLQTLGEKKFTRYIKSKIPLPLRH